MARLNTKGMPALCYTIASFCRMVPIGRTTYYKLRNEGRGPEEIYVTAKKSLITKEAAARWLAAREAEGKTKAKTKVKAKRAAGPTGVGLTGPSGPGGDATSRPSASVAGGNGPTGGTGAAPVGPVVPTPVRAPQSQTASPVSTAPPEEKEPYDFDTWTYVTKVRPCRPPTK
jgi:hypothetical protein